MVLREPKDEESVSILQGKLMTIHGRVLDEKGMLMKPPISEKEGG